MTGARRSLAAFAVVVACRSTATTTTPPPEPTPPVGQAPPSRHATGEQLEASVPLQQGGTVSLAELRGKVVLLELSDAAHRDATVLADYEALQREHSDGLAVIVVSLDRDGWTGDVPALLLGWDPAGALGARLRAGSIPAVLLIDRDGRLLEQYAGARESSHARLLTRARLALTAPK
jgi:peroxiredoxin